MLRGAGVALLLAVAGAGAAAAQAPAPARTPGTPRPFLSNLHATRNSPVYTTYAAALERSRFLLDEGYHLRFYDPERPLELVNRRAGTWAIAFFMGGRYSGQVKDFPAEPIITISYGDLVQYHFQPYSGVQVQVTALVYSSRVAVQEVRATNARDTTVELDLLSWLVMTRAPISAGRADAAKGEVRFRHSEPPDGWTKEHGLPHVTEVQDAWVSSAPLRRMAAGVDSSGAERSGPRPKDTTMPDAPVYGYTAWRHVRLAPGASTTWRMARAVAPADSSLAPALTDARRLLRAPLAPFIAADERLYRRIPAPPTTDPERQLLYWGAFTLLRQSFLSPEGQARHPYYVFSREPQWGWGHGGQVFHESLSMLAYALMDPAGAMASQRIFAERQQADGYIPYRVGPYLTETIPYQGQLTTSAPWYSWENWEVYRLTRDAGFLRDMYGSGKRFYDWMAAHRDADGDGLYEWGGHGVLESVRDGDVAVWDQVGWPANFEALDLNVMMAAEAGALDSMAAALRRPAEAALWRARADTLRARIERTFWDESTGFYYHVDLKRHSFSFKAPDDLKRREIIGLLPLWAGTASPARARRLIATLTDSARFWRRNGVPSLAADDPYYNPSGYWNGPVWVEWEYLLERGLLRYGRADLARQLTDRVAENMEAQLRRSHVFWEMYGPDGAPGTWAGHNQVYIWAGMIARMMLDAEDTTGVQRPPRVRGDGSGHTNTQKHQRTDPGERHAARGGRDPRFCVLVFSCDTREGAR